MKLFHNNFFQINSVTSPATGRFTFENIFDKHLVLNVAGFKQQLIFSKLLWTYTQDFVQPGN